MEKSWKLMERKWIKDLDNKIKIEIGEYTKKKKKE